MVVQDQPNMPVIKGKRTPCCHAQHNSQSSIGLMSYTYDLIWYSGGADNDVLP